MATKNFAGPFRTAVNRGTPAGAAVANLAKKSNKPEAHIWSNLFAHDVVSRRKINGNFVYWPNWKPGRSARSASHKTNTWGQIIGWAITSGYCTPEQVNTLKSQKDFFNFFGPFFAQQFGWTVSSGWTKTKVKAWGSSNGTRRTSNHTNGRTRTTSKKRIATANRKRSTTRSAKHPRTTTVRGRKTTSSTRSYGFPKSGIRSRTYRRAA